MFFVCLNGITTGIAHPPTKKSKVTVEYKCGTRVTTNKCTDVQVSLGLSSGKYCRMCYRKQLTTELSSKDRQQRCRTSAMVCSFPSFYVGPTSPIMTNLASTTRPPNLCSCTLSPMQYLFQRRDALSVPLEDPDKGTDEVATCSI